MKRFLTALALIACHLTVCLAQNTGVYVGGHIRRERPKTVETLKKSGFTYVILFNVSVETDGTLTTDGETICKDGQYVFANQQPYYVEDVKALKTWPTAIERIEICIGGWGNESYNRIRDLVNSQGVGHNSIMYRNFKALKDAIPEIDAVNNDDEHCYDAATAVKFHTMMYDLGYKTTVAPYTNKSFWQSLVNGLNGNRKGACDRVLIQCYGGGIYNNPSDWKLGGLPVHAGRENYQTNMETSIAQMDTWRQNNGVVGGFVWVYNDDTWNLNKWASQMNRVFPAKTVTNPVVTLYTGSSFTGDAIQLGVGEYCCGELSTYGLADKSIMSYRMEPGYMLTGCIYDGLDNKGQTSSIKSWTDTEMERLGTMSRRITSLKIEKVEEQGLSPSCPSLALPQGKGTVYDLQGRRQESQKHGIVIVNGKKVKR